MNERSAALLLAIIAGYNMWVIVAKHQPFRYAPTIDLAPMVQGMIVCLLGFMACITVSPPARPSPPHRSSSNWSTGMASFPVFGPGSRSSNPI